MRNIEKAFTKYVRGTGAMVPADVVCEYAERNPNSTINILFKVISKELDSITGRESLDRVRELLKNVHVIMINIDGVNRKIIYRKLQKLDEKIDRIKSERRQKIVDAKRANQELESLRREIEILSRQNEESETKQYQFLDYLASEMKNITYLEYTFNKMPTLINARDKDGVSFFLNTVEDYVLSLKDGSEEDILYYDNLISLILSKKTFHLSEVDRKKCLDYLHLTLNQMSIGKKQIKKNKKKIERIERLRDTLKGMTENEQEIDSIANKYHISVFFDPDLIEDARVVRNTNVGKMTGREVVDDYIITIDGENAVEIDDALSCRKLPNGNYLLGVHIASVLGYFPYDSPMVEEAISRNHSIYLPRRYRETEDDFNRTIPIFPYSFSAEKASLIVGGAKLARSYYFEIDSMGNVVREDFKKTIIRSNKQTTYKEVDQVLEHGSDDKIFQETVENLQKVTDLLDSQYKGDSLYENVKENMDDYSDLRVRRVGAEKIVAQTMMLTGNRVAEYFADSKRGYPCLYRVHEVNESDTMKLKSMIDNLTRTYGGDQYDKLYQLIAGIYPKGWYATEGSHAGLGLDHYCHCTSGLRRAADIVVEHALEVCYDREPTDGDLDLLSDEVSRRASQINAKQDPIDWFIKDYRRAYQRRR